MTLREYVNHIYELAKENPEVWDFFVVSELPLDPSGWADARALTDPPLLVHFDPQTLIFLSHKKPNAVLIS